MKSAFTSTLFLAILAIASAAVAAIFYPWPESEVSTDLVQLFESYDGTQVRGLEIVQYNRDRGALEEFKLVRFADRWQIPSKENYIASQGSRISLAVNSLSDLKVLEIMSDNQQDHLDYGVVDPEDFQNATNRSALGTKITLTDRNQQEIASLIVGLPVKNDPVKHFARITGQPSVYVINYDPRILTTQLGGWISTNPLQLVQQQGDGGQQVNAIDIDNYRIEGEDINNLTRNTLYLAKLRALGNRLGVESVETSVPGSSELATVTVDPASETRLMDMVKFLTTIITYDVKRKNPEAGKAIRSTKEFPASDTESMRDFGYVNCRNVDGNFECDSTNGQIRMVTPEGVVMTMSIGNIAGSVQDGSGKLTYTAIFSAGIDNEALKIPEPPADLPADEESDEVRAYRRLVQDSEKKRDNARRIATDFNSLHSDWYYTVGDDLIQLLRPDITVPKPAAETTRESDENNGSTDESGESDDSATDDSSDDDSTTDDNQD